MAIFCIFCLALHFDYPPRFQQCLNQEEHVFFIKVTLGLFWDFAFSFRKLSYIDIQPPLQ